MNGEIMKKRIQVIFLVLIISILLSVCMTSVVSLQNVNASEQDNIGENVLSEMKLHFLDVGQGDSCLVILPNKEVMLIDAGTSDKESTVVNYIKDLNISKIDYLVMTHPDADHIGGMSSVIDNFEIGNIYMTNKTSTTKTFEDLLGKIDDNNMNITIPKANEIISEDNDFEVKLVSPIKEYDDNNDMSLVLQITHNENSFLLMGDASSEVEEDILNSNPNISADLIKIGHHGSSYSSSANFIEQVSPKFAIISSGNDNQYGHPSNMTLETLNKFSVKIYRTDQLGHIIASSDGNTINITNKKENKFIFF